MSNLTKKRIVIVPTLGLFTSFSTLMCCALPALLVSLGAGATLASIVSHIPSLIWLSQHKVIAFSIAGIMLIIAGVLTWRNRSLPCPTDPRQAITCMRLKRMSYIIYGFSVFIYCIGFFFAFIAKYFFS